MTREQAAELCRLAEVDLVQHQGARVQVRVRAYAGGGHQLQPVVQWWDESALRERIQDIAAEEADNA